MTKAVAAAMATEQARSADDLADVTLVADNFVSLMRSFNRVRSRLLAAAEHDVEWSAQVLLRAVANDGPIRAGSLAELVQSDPSTVSRQVAALVKDGLLERRADQGDGRASLLVVTERAQAVLAEHDAIRISHFADMLADWTDADLRTFGQLLQRFTSDFDRASENNPISEKVVTRDRSAGRNA